MHQVARSPHNKRLEIKVNASHGFNNSNDSSYDPFMGNYPDPLMSPVLSKDDTQYLNSPNEDLMRDT
jgi:hypothetical protein